MHAHISKIIVGSKNPVKIAAVKEVIADYGWQAKIISKASTSNVREQPLTLAETVLGAKMRAKNAYQDLCFSIGIESGLMQIPSTEEDVMNVCICSVFDGMQHHLGMSCGYRIPKTVATLLMQNDKIDMNEAMQRLKLTDHPRLGSHEGSIGLFSNGRITRKDYCKQSLITALIAIENGHFFHTESLDNIKKRC